VATHASLPSTSTRIHHFGECSADEAAAGSQGCGDAGLGLVLRYGDIEVHAVALWAYRLHLLRSEAWASARRVSQEVVRDSAIAEHRLPERQQVRADERVERGTARR
jgi:hypothetical protein